MEIKSENSIREYLQSLSDDVILKYYVDVEYTPFPILIVEEYHRRFKTKSKKDILKQLRYESSLVKRKSKELASVMKQQKFINEITREKTNKILQAAKNKGYEIGDVAAKKGILVKSKMTKHIKTGIKKGIDITKSSKRDLELLSKLDELRKAGIITEVEFKKKKKKILNRI